MGDPHAALIAAERAGDLVPGGLLVVAVSGGRDSMALCFALRASDRFRLAVVTVDHGLREGSARDAEFVADQARLWGLPVCVERVEPGRLDPGEGPEDAARRTRHRLLEARRAALGGAAIMLAHTADDRVETLLMRLAQGAGTRGLGGLPARAGWLRRPWVGVRRERIAAYVAERGIPFVEDPTNADGRFVRNRVRAALLPALVQTFGRNAVSTAASTAERLHREATALDALLAPILMRAVLAEPCQRRGEVHLDAQYLRSLDPAVRAVAIHRLVLGLYVSADVPPPRSLAARVARVDAAVVAGQGRGVGGRDGFAFRQGRGLAVMALGATPAGCGAGDGA